MGQLWTTTRLLVRTDLQPIGLLCSKNTRTSNSHAILLVQWTALAERKWTVDDGWPMVKGEACGGMARVWCLSPFPPDMTFRWVDLMSLETEIIILVGTDFALRGACKGFRVIRHVNCGSALVVPYCTLHEPFCG